MLWEKEKRILKWRDAVSEQMIFLEDLKLQNPLITTQTIKNMYLSA